MAHSARPRVVPVPTEIRNFVAGLIRVHGARRAAAQLELSRHATLALAVGVEAARGTIAIARQAMGRSAA
jgi:hypothetical protein